jgi:pyrimidine operon attenuation protein/uracil phosphoribosyltransferase
MTRAERKAQERARQARIAVHVFAKHIAKRQLIAGIKARGERVANYSNKQLTLMSEALMCERPEIVAQARESARQLGYI